MRGGAERGVGLKADHGHGKPLGVETRGGAGQVGGMGWHLTGWPHP